MTLEGNKVISVGLFGHSGDDEVWTEGTNAMLDDMHLRKIDMADEATTGLGALLPRPGKRLNYGRCEGVEVCVFVCRYRSMKR